MTISARDVHLRRMENPEYAKAYAEAGPRMELAFQIAEARARASLNQEELAVAIGSSQTQVSRWERGRSAPTGDYLRRVAAATGSRLMIVPEEAVAAVETVIIRRRPVRRPAKNATRRPEQAAPPRKRARREDASAST